MSGRSCEKNQRYFQQRNLRKFLCHFGSTACLSAIRFLPGTGLGFAFSNPSISKMVLMCFGFGFVTTASSMLIFVLPKNSDVLSLDFPGYSKSPILNLHPRFGNWFATKSRIHVLVRKDQNRPHDERELLLSSHICK